MENTENTQLTAAVEAAVEANGTATSEETHAETTQTESTAGAGVSSEATQEAAAAATSDPGETQEAQKPSQAEMDQALGLFNLLRNPETAPRAAEMLARQFGIIKDPPKEETKSPGIKDIIAASLGPEYAFLAEKLGPAMEQAIGSAMAPHIRQTQMNQIQAEFTEARRDLDVATKGDFVKNEAAIIKMMDRMRPADGVPIKDYLNDLYTLAKSSKSQSQVSRETAGKVVSQIKQNASERLPSPSAVPETKMVKGPNRPTLAESIAAAVRGERFEG